jgi:hypothetical protein
MKGYNCNLMSEPPARAPWISLSAAKTSRVNSEFIGAAKMFMTGMVE